MLSDHCKSGRRLPQVRVIDDNKGLLISGLHPDTCTVWLAGIPTCVLQPNDNSHKEPICSSIHRDLQLSTRHAAATQSLYPNSIVAAQQSERLPVAWAH